MRRSPIPKIMLTLTLTAMLAACGGAQQATEEPSPTETGEAPTEQVQQEPTETEESLPVQEETQEQAQAEEEPEPSGPTATTIDGEEVSLGGQDVTALFFMAGW